MKTILFTSIATLLLCFTGQAQIINGDFEDLNDTTAANWDFNDFGSGITTDYAQSGTYALAVWNWYYYAKGFVVNGEKEALQFGQMPGSGTPSTEKALRLTGYYFYDTTGTDTNNDTALITVAYRNWDSTNQKYDTVAYGIQYLLATSGNDPFAFSMPITDIAPGVDPDTVLIMIQSSLNGFCDASGGGNCLYLYVDELKLESTTGIADAMSGFKQTKIYPNPTSDAITVVVNKANTQWQLFDLAGKLVSSTNLVQGENQIDLSNQPSGIYMVVLTENGKVVGREKLVKQ